VAKGVMFSLFVCSSVCGKFEDKWVDFAEEQGH